MIGKEFARAFEREPGLVHMLVPEWARGMEPEMGLGSALVMEPI